MEHVRYEKKSLIFNNKPGGTCNKQVGFDERFH